MNNSSEVTKALDVSNIESRYNFNKIKNSLFRTKK